MLNLQKQRKYEFKTMQYYGLLYIFEISKILDFYT